MTRIIIALTIALQSFSAFADRADKNCVVVTRVAKIVKGAQGKSAMFVGIVDINKSVAARAIVPRVGMRTVNVYGYTGRKPFDLGMRPLKAGDVQKFPYIGHALKLVKPVGQNYIRYFTAFPTSNVDSHPHPGIVAFITLQPQGPKLFDWNTNVSATFGFTYFIDTYAPKQACRY